MSEARTAGMSALSDPLLKALVDKLPMPGAPFPAADRGNWLRMFVMALNSAYGVAEPIGVTELEERPRGRLQLRPVLDDEPPRVRSLPEASAEVAEAAEAAARGRARQGRYIIDEEGFATRDGRPFAPEDVPAGEAVDDYRNGGDRGDLASVFWKGEGTRKPESLPAIKLRLAA